MIHLTNMWAWVITNIAPGWLGGYSKESRSSLSNPNASSIKWANNASSNWTICSSVCNFSTASCTRARMNSTLNFVALSPKLSAIGWTFLWTQSLWSLIHVRIWVKNHSGLSGRFVCLLPVKWYWNLCLSGLTSREIGKQTAGNSARSEDVIVGFSLASLIFRKKIKEIIFDILNWMQFFYK